MQRPATAAIHAGDPPRAPGRGVAPSPEFSTSFHTAPDAIGFSGNDLKDGAPPFYTRWGNPTSEVLEHRLAVLEGGEAAVVFASGMAAISALFLQKLSAGDHLVYSDVCYAGVAELAHDVLPRHGIAATPVDTSDPAAVAAALRPNTRLLHLETPANPTLKLSDIAALAAIVHPAGVALSVDSTIATPLATRPLALGADYVVHSLTKYIGGHGDALAGAVIGGAAAMAELRRHSLIHFGAAASPFTAWLILRGLETLAPRMALHQANARRVEAFLATHPRVDAVFWPGSPRHPQHALGVRQMANYSGLLAFTVRGDAAAVAAQMAQRVRLVSYAVSLGKTRCLLFYLPTDDLLRASFRLGDAAAASYRAWAGEGVFRLSVGLEDAEDIIADLDQALA